MLALNTTTDPGSGSGSASNSGTNEYNDYYNNDYTYISTDGEAQNLNKKRIKTYNGDHFYFFVAVLFLFKYST